MFGYNVQINHYCNHSEQINHSDAAYDYSWEESWSNSFERITKTDQYPDVNSIHDFAVGEQAYLVWADWNTGDSFGNGDRTYYESYALFKNQEDAYAYSSALEHARNGNDFKWVSSEGQVFENIYIPWHGYFESLGGVYVETVTIGA